MALIEAFDFTLKFNSRILFLQELCNILLPTWMDAREIYLETAYKAFKEKESYNPKSDFDGWLLDILFNVLREEKNNLKIAA